MKIDGLPSFAVATAIASGVARKRSVMDSPYAFRLALGNVHLRLGCKNVKGHSVFCAVAKRGRRSTVDARLRCSHGLMVEISRNFGMKTNCR